MPTNTSWDYLRKTTLRRFEPGAGVCPKCNMDNPNGGSRLKHSTLNHWFDRPHGPQYSHFSSFFSPLVLVKVLHWFMFPVPRRNKMSNLAKIRMSTSSGCGFARVIITHGTAAMNILLICIILWWTRRHPWVSSNTKVLTGMSE